MDAEVRKQAHEDKVVRGGGGGSVQSGSGDTPSEGLHSKRGSEKKEFGIEAAANRKLARRLMVSEFGDRACSDKIKNTAENKSKRETAGLRRTTVFLFKLRL